MKQILPGLAAILFLIQSANADTSNPALIKDMVSFDQTYIPALALTSQQKPKLARKAIFLLQTQWEAFGMRYTTLVANDPQWQMGFENVGNALKAAENYTRSAQWLKAHEALEPIRNIFKDLRTQRGIDYFIDDLTAFHDVMETLVKTAQKSEPLSPADITRIRALHAEANTLWRHVETRPFDAALFGFDAEKTQMLKQHIAQERDALTTLDTALIKGNPKAIAQAARKIKPPFAKAFMLFGDFKPVQ